MAADLFTAAQVDASNDAVDKRDSSGMDGGNAPEVDIHSWCEGYVNLAWSRISCSSASPIGLIVSLKLTRLLSSAALFYPLCLGYRSTMLAVLPNSHPRSGLSHSYLIQHLMR